MDYSLEFGGKDINVDDLRITTFADASLADRLLSRHSISGYAIFIAGALVL